MGDYVESVIEMAVGGALTVAGIYVPGFLGGVFIVAGIIVWGGGAVHLIRDLWGEGP